LLYKDLHMQRDEVSSLNTLLIRANDTIYAKPEGHIDQTFINLLNQQHKKGQQNGEVNAELASATQLLLERLQSENENQKLELESRPTLSQWKELKNTTAELEKSLHQHITK
jgi:cell shape-determining protein MreC